jgi:hypothetical protein
MPRDMRSCDLTDIWNSHAWDILTKVYGRQRSIKPPHPTSDTAMPITPCFLNMVLQLPPTAPTRRHPPIH